jgi:hypothetical protein
VSYFFPPSRLVRGPTWGIEATTSSNTISSAYVNVNRRGYHSRARPAPTTQNSYETPETPARGQNIIHTFIRMFDRMATHYIHNSTPLLSLNRYTAMDIYMSLFNVLHRPTVSV